MLFADYFSIAVISILWIASFPRCAGRGRFSFAKWGFISAIIGIIAILLYFTHLQWLAWQANDVSKYLIPPYHSIHYFLFYVWTRLWAPYAVSLLVALLGYAALWFLNKRFEGRFFEQEELLYVAIGLFVSGHPGWIIYMIIVLAAYLLFSLVSVAASHAMRRLSFYYAWLPLAALAIILNASLLNYNWYNNLII